MQRCTQRAAGGTIHRLKPGPVIMRSRCSGPSKAPRPLCALVVGFIDVLPVFLLQALTDCCDLRAPSVAAANQFCFTQRQRQAGLPETMRRFAIHPATEIQSAQLRDPADNSYAGPCSRGAKRSRPLRGLTTLRAPDDARPLSCMDRARTRAWFQPLRGAAARCSRSLIAIPN